jgi:hypothetical protein
VAFAATLYGFRPISCIERTFSPQNRKKKANKCSNFERLKEKVAFQFIFFSFPKILSDMSSSHPWPAWDPSYDRTWDMLHVWVETKLRSLRTSDTWGEWDWFGGPKPVGLRADACFRAFVDFFFDVVSENENFRAIVGDLSKSALNRILDGYEERVRTTVLPEMDARLIRRLPAGLGSSAYYLTRECMNGICGITRAYLGEGDAQSWLDLADDSKMGLCAPVEGSRYSRHDEVMRLLGSSQGYVSYCGEAGTPEKLALFLANIVRKEQLWNFKRRMLLLAVYLS